MLLSIIGIFSISAFAVRATDTFSEGVNVGINQVFNDVSRITCKNELGRAIPCNVDLTVGRVLAPYTQIDQYWPTPAEFSSAPSITVLAGETKTINPGTYNSIIVDVSKNKKSYGVLIMNPGVYRINEYTVKGQVLPGDVNGTDPEGTVTILVKTTLNFTGSSNNCITNNKNKRVPYQHSNRYVVYTEDSAATVNDVCMSGYIYFKEDINTGSMNLWGSISAKTISLDNGAKVNVNVDLDHLIFTNFEAFLEIGPQMNLGWHMVKAPADISTTNVVTVGCFFGDDLNTSTYGTEWIVYQRDYDEVTHQKYYTALTLTTPLEKSRGYWLGLKKEAELKVLGLDPVAWDDTIVGCTSINGCTRYTLQSCSVGDTSPYLYDLVGSVGTRKSDWKDYRIEVDNNGTVMTPTGAMEAGIMNNQIWKYAPSASGTYVTVDDSGLVDSTIDYFEGFWVELNCTNSIGKTIDLIIPNRM